MNILSNIILRINDTVLSNSSSDYVRVYFQEYFGYEYDSDIVVNLYTLQDASSEYGMFERYREMLDDRVSIQNASYLTYMKLIDNKQTYGLYNAMAKNLVYQGWRDLGSYFTSDCKARFKNTNKPIFDFILANLKNGLTIEPYRVSFRCVIDYIELMTEIVSLNSYSFFNGVSRKMWYAIEDRDIFTAMLMNGQAIPSSQYSQYRIRLFLPKNKSSRVPLFSSYVTGTKIPAGYLYRIEKI